MNKKEKELDRMTRKLLAGTEVTPSPSFDARLMSALVGECRRVYPYRMGSRFSSVVVFAIIYTLVSLFWMWAGGFLEGMGGLSVAREIPMEFYPIALTVGAAVACFLLFTRLDDYWRVKSGI